MLDYSTMTHDELKECALLAAEAFSDYEYFSIYILLRSELRAA